MTNGTATSALGMFYSPPELSPVEDDRPEIPEAESRPRAAKAPLRPQGRPGRRMVGADQITSVHDGSQYGLTDQQLTLIRRALSDKGIDANPSNILHFLEAEDLRDLLREVGINPTKKVSSTRDREGMVWLTFTELRQLMDLGHAA